jgi:hypothetical protein
MILLWLLVWWAHNFPSVHPWNDWFIWMIVAIVLA